MMEQLYQHIKKIIPGFAVEPQELLPYFKTKLLKKDEVLLGEGEICLDIYFVNKGGLYMFYEDRGKQVVHFALENWWITDYKTFPDGKPAVYAIAAMEDSEMIYLSRENYDALLSKFPSLALYFNRVHERAYGAALFKQKTFATVPKDDFYRQFRANYPELKGRIPDVVFASYMGVTVEFLKSLEDDLIS